MFGVQRRWRDGLTAQLNDTITHLLWFRLLKRDWRKCFVNSDENLDVEIMKFDFVIARTELLHDLDLDL